MAEPSTSITDVIAFLQERADENDLDTIHAAIRARRMALLEQDSAAVKPGMAVTLHRLKPKYLNGLNGTIKTIVNGKTRRATVTLDAESTGRLAFASEKYLYLADRTSFDFDGVPVTCCKPTS